MSSFPRFNKSSPGNKAKSKHSDGLPLTTFILTVSLLFCLAHPITALAKTNSNSRVDDTSYFRIPKTDIRSAIVMFAEQANIQIIYVEQDKLTDFLVGPVHGRMSNRTALTELLLNTPLKFRSNNDDTVVVLSHLNKENSAQHNLIDQASSPQNSRTLIEEVIINGFKGALSTALNEKQRTLEIEDFIYQQTISKYPDHNAAEALQRLPGVSVDRIWGESRDVYIRGTSKEYNQTLVNGQYFSSAYSDASEEAGRSFNFFLVPSDLLSSIQVNKGPSASQAEGSIGGSINLRLHTPFTLPKKLLRFSHKQHFSELSDAFSPKNNVTANWVNETQSLGLTLNLSHQKRDTRRDALEVFLNPQPLDITAANNQLIEDVFIPLGLSSTLFHQKRDRLTYHAALQWAPTNNSTFTFNLLRSEMNFANSNQNYIVTPLFSVFTGTPLLDTHFMNSTFGNPILTQATTSDSSSVGSMQTLIIRDTNVNNALYDVLYQRFGENANLTIQLGFTDANGGSDHEFTYNFEEQTRINFRLNRNQVNFSVLDINPARLETSPHITSYSDSIRQTEDRSAHFQIDSELFFANSPFFSLKLGYKWQKHTAHDNRKVAQINPNSSAWDKISNVNFNDLISDNQLTLNRRTIGDDRVIQRYTLLSPDRVRNTINDNLQRSDYQYIKFNDHEIRELINAVYIQGEIETSKHQINTGVRVSNTHLTTNTLQNNQFIVESHRYTNLLPSANWKYFLNDNTFLRANISKAIARPLFSQSIGGAIQSDLLLSQAHVKPKLKPVSSKQGEIGIEWYKNENAILAVYYFYKDISDIIFTNSIEVDNSGTTISYFDHGDGPSLRGVELQLQQDIFKNAGLTFNYTYTHPDQTQYYLNRQHNFVGHSRDQLNASLYFENRTLSARLSYNYRSKSFDSFSSEFQMVTQAFDQWDMDINYSLNRELSLSFEAVNILNETVKVTSVEGIPNSFYENGAHYIVGLQYSFW